MTIYSRPVFALWRSHAQIFSFPFGLSDAPPLLPFVVLAYAAYLVLTNACALSAYASRSVVFAVGQLTY